MTEIKALTSLRGIAAMMVVMQHFSATAQLHAAGSIPSLVPHGYMAVDLFFVLSGYIMAYTYHDDFALHGVRAMPSFLLKRAARILPLNTVVVTGIVLAGATSQIALGNNIFYPRAASPYDVICNLLLLQGFGAGLNLNGPSWSICSEFAAYLLFPALLVMVFSRRATPVVLAALLSFGGLGFIASSHARLGLAAETVGEQIILCFAGFVLGLLSFRLTRITAVRNHLRRDLAALLPAAWIATFLCLRLDLLAAIGFPALVAALACNRGRVATLLSTAPLYVLGEISFSIYLIHDPCRPLALEAIRAIHPARLATVPALGFALLASFLVLPLAWAAYRVVERPGRRFMRGLAARLVQPKSCSHAINAARNGSKLL